MVEASTERWRVTCWPALLGTTGRDSRAQAVLLRSEGQKEMLKGGAAPGQSGSSPECGHAREKV